MKQIHKTFCAMATIGFCLLTPPAHAELFGDLIGIGVQVGGKLTGAAIDKMTEKSPEELAQEREERDRQMAAQMERDLATIEAQPNLRPIDRERLILKYREMYAKNKDFEEFLKRSDAQKRAERDKLFTAGGLTGVVGNAAANQAGTHVALKEADLAANDPAAYKNMQKAQEAQNVANTLSAAEKTAEILSQPGEQPASAVVAATHNGDIPATGDAFAPDMGKKIWIKFEGSSEQTEQFRKALVERGHVLAESQDSAEVTYLVQGEYSIPDTGLYNGMIVPVGKILDNPSEEITPPEKKTSGSIKRGLSTFMLVAAGQQVPKEAQDNRYRQKVLLVLARQPKDGKETRVSVVSTTESEKIEATVLAKKSLDDMQSLLGIQTPQNGAGS